MFVPRLPANAAQDFVAERLRRIPGIRLAEPQGAFYVLPEVSAFMGEEVEAEGFGPVPDVDALCRCCVELPPGPFPPWMACLLACWS